MSDWNLYVEKTKNNPPRPLLIEAMEFLKYKEVALDMGAGSLNDTKYLLDSGFKKVVALDHENLAQSAYDLLPQEKVSYVISPFDKYDFPKNKFDIINAQYSLPFNNPISFQGMFNKLKDSLKIGGIFVGQLFGENDEWNNGKRNMTFHTKSDIEQLLQGMEIIKFMETEKDQKPAIGKIKHWHIFDIIVRKI